MGRATEEADRALQLSRASEGTTSGRGSGRESKGIDGEKSRDQRERERERERERWVFFHGAETDGERRRR